MVYVRQDMLIGCSLEMITLVSTGKMKQAHPSLFSSCDENLSPEYPVLPHLMKRAVCLVLFYRHLLAAIIL